MSCSVSRNNQDLFLAPLKQRYGFLQREDRIIRKPSLNRCGYDGQHQETLNLDSYVKTRVVWS